MVGGGYQHLSIDANNRRRGGKWDPSSATDNVEGCEGRTEEGRLERVEKEKNL